MATEMTPSEVAEMLANFRFGEVAARTSDIVRPGIVDRMRMEAPYDAREHSASKTSPHLRDTFYSVRHTSLDGGQLYVFSTSDHVKYVIHGTQPHEIHPKGVTPDQTGGGHPLAFFWEKVGEQVASFGWHSSFYGFVEHPGTKPDRFHERSWYSVRGGVVAAFRDQIREGLLHLRGAL